jgi:carbonic anhydrase
MEAMSAIEPHTPALARILAENARYADQLDRTALPIPHGSKLAVLACMDPRLKVEHALGLHSGEAHIVRNAGGLATDDAIRSLVISQQVLGTTEVFVIAHTDCAMLTFRDADVQHELVARTGADVDLAFHAFSDLASNLREQVRRIEAHPWIKDAPVHGLIYDVETGRLREVA